MGPTLRLPCQVMISNLRHLTLGSTPLVGYFALGPVIGLVGGKCGHRVTSLTRVPFSILYKVIGCLHRPSIAEPP